MKPRTTSTTPGGLQVAMHRNCRGTTTGEKLRGTKAGSQHPALAPRAPRPAKGLAGCWVREGVAPFRCEGPGRGYHPGKSFENSDAKSCILVTTLIISGENGCGKLGIHLLPYYFCFLMTYQNVIFAEDICEVKC